jgi:hypothetical protein
MMMMESPVIATADAFWKLIEPVGVRNPWVSGTEYTRG